MARYDSIQIEVADGKLMDHFPLVVWQTGSGTQTNMNANEVIANRANEILTGKKPGRQGAHAPQRPRQHGPVLQRHLPHGAMHIAAVQKLVGEAIPALGHLHATRSRPRPRPSKIVKIGRTHLHGRDAADAGPGVLRLRHRSIRHQARLESALPRLLRAGPRRHRRRHRLQRHPKASPRPSPPRSPSSRPPFVTAPNKFEALAAHDAIVESRRAQALAVS
jgi:fumarate hydratase, class II